MTPKEPEESPMSHRLKITLPEPAMTQLEAIAEQREEPVSRIAAQMVCNQTADGQTGKHNHTIPVPEPAEVGELDDPDCHAPWIEPVMGDPDWRQRMWSSISDLHERYPRELGHLKEGWWEDTTHVEMLCALVFWRNWIDRSDDPRYELAFHAQLADYSRELRQEGGSVTRAWKPGAPPDEWAA